MTDSIIYTRDHQIARITFNRPGKLNAFNREMAYELERITEEVKADSSVRMVVMRGNGEAFMSGSDLHEMHAELEMIEVEGLTMARRFNNSILALREMDKPVLSIVHGMVTGTGMSVMLSSDLVLACETTRFSLGFSRIGTSPAGAVSYSLPRLIGTKKAMELLLLSEVIDAHKAEALGLINWVVAEEDLESRAQQLIERLVNGPAIAFAQTKQLIYSGWQNRLIAQLELEAESFGKCVGTRDFKTAVRAFINKRIPEFEGR